MKRFALALVALTILLVTPAVMADESGETAATGEQTLEGEFIWARDDGDVAGPLKAVFESTGDARWNVSFYFTFEDKAHIYRGTAEGVLGEGELKGEVLSDGEQQHPYSFSGTFAEDGSFAGTHAYIDGEEARPTGTISFGR